MNRELNAYKRLLEAIRASVEDLLDNIDGKHPRPLEVEALWRSVQQNSVPEAWRSISFPTARESLADFLVELCLRLKYWKRLVEAEPDEGAPTYWLRAFYDPRALLRALIQTRARAEGIPLAELRNEFEVLEAPNNERASSEPNVAYLQGLALEGAEWHTGDRQLVEVASSARFTSFPGLRVRTVRMATAPGVTESVEAAAASFKIVLSKGQDPTRFTGFGKPKGAAVVEEVVEEEP